ncbi:MAG: hypothetical protein JW811_10095 [Clostridiales bacterium]|nr:hypothetical protein [Clostridiales bacterium]
MLYQILSRMIARGNLAGLSDKLDVFFTASRLTEMEYQELRNALVEGEEQA